MMVGLTEYFIKDLDNISTDNRNTTKLLHKTEEHNDKKWFVNL